MTTDTTKPIAVRVNWEEGQGLLHVLRRHGYSVENLWSSMGFYFYLHPRGYITIGPGLPGISSTCAGHTEMEYQEFMETYVESYNDN